MSNPQSYDLVILGGGAAAFAALTEARGQDRSVALVNAGLPLGGTCVNVGCIPSKHLLEVAKAAFEPLRTPFQAIRYDGGPTRDWGQALAEKDRIVDSLRQQNYLDVAEHFEVDVFEGWGRVQSPNVVEVHRGPDEGARVQGKKVLIATGSSPRIAPIDGIEGAQYETSETILRRSDLPERVIMIGGGYVGLEWGQILHRMGSEVTLLQRSSHVLSKMEPLLGREIQRCFAGEGLEVHTDASVQRITSDASTVTVEATVDGAPRFFVATDLFMATGVRPNTVNLGLEEVGIEVNENRSLVVNEHFQTTHPDVYGAGDAVGEPMLETTAAKEANLAVKNAFEGQQKTIDYNTVPKVIFTTPEVASVGITEARYIKEHGTCACRTVRMEDIPKARAVKDTRGLVQIVKHHETDRIMGVHMVGPRAADMIVEATLAVKFGLTIDDIIDTVHPFPTFSEAFKHACQTFRRDLKHMSCCVE